MQANRNPVLLPQCGNNSEGHLSLKVRVEPIGALASITTQFSWLTTPTTLFHSPGLDLSWEACREWTAAVCFPCRACSILETSAKKAWSKSFYHTNRNQSKKTCSFDLRAIYALYDGDSGIYTYKLQTCRPRGLLLFSSRDLIVLF